MKPGLSALFALILAVHPAIAATTPRPPPQPTNQQLMDAIMDLKARLAALAIAVSTGFSADAQSFKSLSGGSSFAPPPPAGCSYSPNLAICQAAPANGSFSYATYFSASRQTWGSQYLDINAVSSAHPVNWNVPGVDFNVGYDTSLARAVPGVDTPPTGCTYSASGSLGFGGTGKVMTCTGNNIDFETNGKWWDLTSTNLWCTGCTGTFTFKNVLFRAVPGDEFDVSTSGSLAFINTDTNNVLSCVGKQFEMDGGWPGVTTHSLVGLRCHTNGPQNLTLAYWAVYNLPGRPFATSAHNTVDIGPGYIGPFVFDQSGADGHGELLVHSFQSVGTGHQTGTAFTVDTTSSEPDFAIATSDGITGPLFSPLTETISSGSCVVGACPGSTLTASTSQTFATSKIVRQVNAVSTSYHDIAGFLSVNNASGTGLLYITDGDNDDGVSVMQTVAVNRVVSITNRTTVPDGLGRHVSTAAAAAFFQNNNYPNLAITDVAIDPSGALGCFKNSFGQFGGGQPVITRVFNMTDGSAITSPANWDACNNHGS